MNSTLTTLIFDATTETSKSAADSAIGYAALLISCLGFGLMFAPMRKVDSRDGFFVQWVQCSVVFLFGFIINIIRDFPKFEPIAAIGGILYATGNLFSIPIVARIGAGLSLLFWGSIQVMVGWAVARFGLPFDLLNESPVQHNALNYIGMFLTLICGIMFIFVKHENDERNVINEKVEQKETIELEESQVKIQQQSAEKTSLNETLGKLPYIGMACCLGVLHGLMMCPLDILKQKHPSDDKYRVFDFCFSYFSTIFFFSTIYFVIYCVVRRKKIYVNSAIILPTLVYGILWNVGMTFWFLSSDKLEQTVAYPITTRLPAIMSALIDVVIFKSIRGRNNLLYLSFCCLLGVMAVILIAEQIDEVFPLFLDKRNFYDEFHMNPHLRARFLSLMEGNVLSAQRLG
ncbi:unnamed protein product, partial [Mesorhabditis belari]|uniref:Uncharacterized protein n=1 Tax=Mesorhabditis belari TaxID=2138241 RepID=A0AAF3EN92_9BILA